MATFLVGFVWRAYIEPSDGFSVLPYLALRAFYLPMLGFYVFQQSTKWGPVLGPALTGFLSCHVGIIASAYAIADALEVFDLAGKYGWAWGIGLPALAADLALFKPLDAGISYLLPLASTFTSAFTPVKVQLLIASTYAMISPKKPYWMFTLAIPAVVHAFFANPHFDSPRNVGVLNKALQPLNWTMLDRQWSNTGYLSVLESLDMQYRVLRCDHSLLGGEWLLTDERRKEEGWLVNEPIYAVFAMLEAVRLLEVESPVPDSAAQALVVGLGIGTAPKAFMAHGINTTVIELDPVVHQLATQYFDLPSEHTAILQDAVTWVDSAAVVGTQRYDYIVHDVFTGGAEPLQLFTDKFLADLRSLLQPNGVVAINYAGDLKLPLTGRILNTINQAFDQQCKIFRDTMPVESDSAGTPEDFLNLVVFCRNTPGRITFRQSTTSDFLGSKSRRHYLVPRADHEINFPLDAQTHRSAILHAGEESHWSRQQAESGIRHWHIMRKVLPAAVWELW